MFLNTRVKESVCITLFFFLFAKIPPQIFHLPFSPHTFFCFCVTYSNWTLPKYFTCKESERPNGLDWQILGSGDNTVCALLSSSGAVAQTLAEVMRLGCFVLQDFNFSLQEKALSSMLRKRYGSGDKWTGKLLVLLVLFYFAEILKYPPQQGQESRHLS